jgi:hypothetical protein
MVAANLLAILAQQNTMTFPNQSTQVKVGGAALFGVVLTAMLITVAINVVICLLLFNAQKAIPQQFRKIEPAMVWLLLIPLFNLVWNFFVYLRIPESYQDYFRSMGRDVGDAGRGIGLGFSICAACTLIPCVGGFAGLAALVLLIVFLVKIYGLKGQIGSPPGGFPTQTPPPPPTM